MKNRFKNIYSMTTIKDVEREERIIKYSIGIMLLILAIVLIILIIYISHNIKKLKKASLYEMQVTQYQDTQEKQQKDNEQNNTEEKPKQEESKKNENLPQITEEGKQKFATIFRSETKRAFLTFDDGPSTVTPTILQVLKEKGAKATFFMLGSNAEKMPDMVKLVFEEGHYIANHGYSHIYSSIYESPQMVLDEYNRTNEIIKNAIQEPDFNSHLFRFPGGYAGGKYAQIKEQAKSILEQNNIFNIDWNCLTGDAETNNPTPEYIMQRLQVTSEGKNSIIILMHDAQAKKVTADTLPQIIDYLAGQGYEFKTFYDIF